MSLIWSRSACCSLITLACLAGAPASVLAQDASAPATVVVVFDGSNSMNGRLPGDATVKHVLVREALRRSLAKIPQGTRMGLAAFGHRRSSDCTDAAMVTQPAVDAGGLMAELERFKPRGFSPVALALREAAAPLAAAPGPASLVIILDDLASCRTEDPCTTATDLAAKNPRLSISVLGLGLNPAAVERMTCVANVARGRLANVQNARELDAALEGVLLAAAGTIAPAPSAASVRPAAPAPRPGVPAAVVPVPTARGLHLTAPLSAGGPPLDRPVRWIVTRDQDTDAPPLAEVQKAYAYLDLPPGRYRVTARIGAIERQIGVDVAATGPTILPVVLDAGVVHVSAVLGKGGGAAVDALITALPADATAGTPRRAVIARAGDGTLVLPAGNWRVAAELGHARVERSVTVRAGEPASVELVLEAGRLALSADGAPGGLRFAISEDDPDSPDGRREIARSAAPAPAFFLPAGAYNLIVRRGEAEVRDRLVIRAGEDLSRRIATGSTRLRVVSRVPAAGDRPVQVSNRILRLDGAEREVAHSTEPDSAFDLAPGRYRIETRLGGQNAIARRDVEVRGDGEQRIAMDPPAGSVQLRVAGASSLQFGEVSWTIVDSSGWAVWRTGQPEPQLVLAAGRYIAQIEARGSRYERAFEVRPGDVSRIDIGG